MDPSGNPLRRLHRRPAPTASRGGSARLEGVNRACIYHSGCPDGFGAAFAVWRAWGDDARYLPRGHYDERLRAGDFEDAVIAFVDIAPDNDQLTSLGQVAEQVIVLDHHVSSQMRFMSDPAVENAMQLQGHTIHFDLEHSGAVLAWQHFHREPVPQLLQYVEDQDLWNWKLPRSEEVNAAIASYPRRFDVWNDLTLRSAEDLASEGTPILRAQQMEVTRVLHSTHLIAIGKRRVAAVNATLSRSSVGHELATEAAYGDPWGCVYRMTGDRVHASLYSIGEFDVSEIAGEYGGGGHRNAAGFTVTLRRWVDEFLQDPVAR
jgi:oligoribonuclease NrnB/cAMP/cGMP phosphodiesterase (DHH superfamily)